MVIGIYEIILINAYCIPLDPDPKEPPTVLLWVLVFLAQHYDILNNSVLALEYINRAIDHTPTHIELYMIKSKILKV